MELLVSIKLTVLHITHNFPTFNNLNSMKSENAYHKREETILLQQLDVKLSLT